jgi:hypothetical protein
VSSPRARAPGTRLVFHRAWARFWGFGLGARQLRASTDNRLQTNDDNAEAAGESKGVGGYPRQGWLKYRVSGIALGAYARGQR